MRFRRGGVAPTPSASLALKLDQFLDRVYDDIAGAVDVGGTPRGDISVRPKNVVQCDRSRQCPRRAVDPSRPPRCLQQTIKILWLPFLWRCGEQHTFVLNHARPLL